MFAGIAPKVAIAMTTIVGANNSKSAGLSTIYQHKSCIRDSERGQPQRRLSNGVFCV